MQPRKAKQSKTTANEPLVDHAEEETAETDSRTQLLHIALKRFTE